MPGPRDEYIVYGRGKSAWDVLDAIGTNKDGVRRIVEDIVSTAKGDEISKGFEKLLHKRGTLQ